MMSRACFFIVGKRVLESSLLSPLTPNVLDWFTTRIFAMD